MNKAIDVIFLIVSLLFNNTTGKEYYCLTSLNNLCNCSNAKSCMNTRFCHEMLKMT